MPGLKTISNPQKTIAHTKCDMHSAPLLQHEIFMLKNSSSWSLSINELVAIAVLLCQL